MPITSRNGIKVPPVEIGETTARILSLSEYEDPRSEISRMTWERSGRNNVANGGVMRTSVVGLWNENATENAERICRLTHADTRCIGYSVVISEIINSLVWQGMELSFEELCRIGYRYDERIGMYIIACKVENLEDLKLDDEQTMGYTLKTMGVPSGACFM